MKDNRDLEETRSKPVVDPARQGGPQRMDEGRRRIAKAGLLAPVIMTLASRQAWGQQGALCWSGAMSGNASGNDHYTCTSGGDPAYWSENDTSWESYSSETTPFHWDEVNGGIFKGTQYLKDDLTSMSLGEVLATDQTRIGPHAVAALLNAANIDGYPLDQLQVVEIVDAILVYGSYTTVNGDLWDETKVIWYFEQTYQTF